MVKRKEILAAVVGVLALSAALRADMVPVSSSDDAVRSVPAATLNFSTSSVKSEASGSPASCWPLPASGLSRLLSGPVVADLRSLSGESVFDWEDTVDLDGVTPPVRILSDRQSSLSLCLYALLGAGLFRSAPLVKKLSFGCIPPWYHDGGPFQIGHSLAIAPDCRCPVQVQCPSQSNWGTDDRISKCHQGAIVCLWRKSQLTPAVFASRGPPP